MPHAPTKPLGARHAGPLFPPSLRELCGEIVSLFRSRHAVPVLHFFARHHRPFVSLTSLMFLLFSFAASAQESTIVNLESQTWPPAAATNPNLLNFNDLLTLSKTAEPTGDLAHRLDSLLTTPFIHEGPDAKPHRPDVANLGPVLRV